MNRWLLASSAVAAFAATWLHLEGGGQAAVHGRSLPQPAAAGTFTWAASTPAVAPAPAPASRSLDEFVLELDADLGLDGAPVDRERIESALRSDPELRRALGLP